MKAIFTRYIHATNHRGSRMAATDGDNRIYISYPDHDRNEDNHEEAAKALAKKMGWDVQLIGGGFKKGMVFVIVPENMRTDKKKG